MPGGWENAANVQNVKVFIPDEATWEEMFPKRNDLYDYTSFMRAVAKYPKFCGEGNCPNYNTVMSCGRELVTLFAHLSQETGYNDPNDPVELHQQALYHIFEMRCADLNGVSKNDPTCDYKSSNWSA